MWLHSDQMFPIHSIVSYIPAIDISDIYNRPILCPQYVVIEEYLVDSDVLVVNEKWLSWMSMVTMAKPEIKIIFNSNIAIWRSQVIVYTLDWSELLVLVSVQGLLEMSGPSECALIWDLQGFQLWLVRIIYEVARMYSFTVVIEFFYHFLEIRTKCPEDYLKVIVILNQIVNSMKETWNDIIVAFNVFLIGTCLF